MDPQLCWGGQGWWPGLTGFEREARYHLGRCAKHRSGTPCLAGATEDNVCEVIELALPRLSEVREPKASSKSRQHTQGSNSPAALTRVCQGISARKPILG